MTVADGACSVPGATVRGHRTVRFTDITFDSRRVVPGCLFVALRGADLDGHRFLDDAIRKGAAAVMVEREAVIPPIVPTIVVSDTRAALAPLSDAFFGHPSHELRVIGITGTDGKTTTSYMLDHLLTAAGMTTGLAGTVTLRIAGVEDQHSLRQTTQESLENQRLLRRMVEAGCDAAILEATSHGLDLHRLDDVRFAAGAITNITHEHLEHHRTIAAYWRAKAILFERLGPGSPAIVNMDDEGARSVLSYARQARVIGYSRQSHPGAILRARNIVSDTSGSRFALTWEGRSADVTLPVIGDFNVDNALCAAGIALALGVPLGEVAVSLATAPAPPGRMVNVAAGQPFGVVVDYAHTPESLTKVLTLLRRLNPTGRLIVVFGSAGDRDPTKRPLQGRAAGLHADHLIVTNEDPRTESPAAILEHIAAGARKVGRRDGTDLDLIEDRAAAIARAVAIAAPGDTVLLAGKGHEKSIFIGHDKIPWDEEQVARDTLRAAGYSAAAG